MKLVLKSQKRNAKGCIQRTHPKGKKDIKKRIVGKAKENKIKCCAKKLCNKIKDCLKKLCGKIKSFVCKVFKAFCELNDCW